MKFLLFLLPKATSFGSLQSPHAVLGAAAVRSQLAHCISPRFYVNTYTKKSQWDKPTAPAVDPNSEAPMGPPPGYTPGSTPAPSDSKTNPFVNQATRPGGSSQGESEDERLARQLQEEENARANAGSRGAANSYMSGSPGPSQYPDQLPPRPGDANDRGNGDKSRGLLGKIFGGNKNKQQQYPGQGGYPQQGGYGSPGPQQGYYQNPPPPQVCVHPFNIFLYWRLVFMDLPTRRRCHNVRTSH